jgi:hypothetical protein
MYGLRANSSAELSLIELVKVLKITGLLKLAAITKCDLSSAYSVRIVEYQLLSIANKEQGRRRILH